MCKGSKRQVISTLFFLLNALFSPHVDMELYLPVEFLITLFQFASRMQLIKSRLVSLTLLF